jgi:hypothetical protein
MKVDFSWTGVSLVIASFINDPWLGVVEPTDAKSAHVRRAYFRTVDLGVYEQILSEIENKTVSRGGYDTNSCESFLRAAGLH